MYFFPEDLNKGKITPKYEIYCNPEGNEYITRIRIRGNEKWSNAMACNLGMIGSYMYNYYAEKTKKRVWQNEEGKREIKEFLGTEEKGIFGLIEWQRKTKDKKIKEAEKRQQAPWDEDMKLIPDIVPSFEGWMKKECTGKYFIFYEYDKKGAKTGYCSHCGKEVPIMNPRHNKDTVCKKCGIKAKFKVTSKIQTLKTDWYTAEIMQKIKGGIVIRTFNQYQYYRDRDCRNPHVITNEISRIMLFENGTVKKYVYGLYKNKINRWIFDKNYIPVRSTYYHEITVKLYKRNFSSIRKSLKYSAIDLWDELPTDTASYLAYETANPAIEKLARLGMFRLAKEIMNERYKSQDMLDQEKTELAKILKIDNKRLERLKKMDGGIYHLEWYQQEKKENKVWSDEMIKDFGDNHFSVSNLEFITEKLSYVKIWNYLKKQSVICTESMRQIRITWNDYLNMAKKAKLNTQNDMIYKPKDLRAAHNEVLMILQGKDMQKEAKKLEKKWPKVNENVKKLKKFEYSDGKYSIIAPTEILDIVKEGTVLRHCVHTCDFYFDRIQKDETYLFFLRKAEHEDVPWYTLEVEPSGNIRQKRTTGDNQNKDFEEAVKFLKKWQKVFKKRMTDEEKKLGIKANEARIKEYEKLRKDGNKVWHGKLAGRLLADVLEEDFMEAI